MNYFKKSVMALTLGATVSASVVGCTSTTAGGAIGADRKQLMLVSNEQILHLSGQAYRETLSEARSQGKLDTNPAQVARLQRIAKKLIAHTSVFRQDAPDWQWEVHAIKSDEMNAYVMPGGKIVFYSGIIDRLQLTDAEIAAIMGHEIAHALREHSREKASRNVATSNVLGIASAAFGLSSGQQQLASLVSQLGLDLPHSRYQEAEADKIGLELMARAGYNPNAGITLWQKMQAKSSGGTPQFLSTHPSSDKRISNMKELMPKVMPLYQAQKS